MPITIDNNPSNSPLNLSPLQPMPQFEQQSISMRLAQNQDEINAAQRLRYKTFYEEFNIPPPPHVLLEERDYDEYDPYADHLIVFDENISPPNDNIVGTYRLFRRENMPDNMKFFSETEFDISNLHQHGGKLLELGRSCTLPAYRNKFVMQKLWQGISDYLSKHQIDLMFGVASFHEEKPENIIEFLSYLHHFHVAPKNLCVQATENCLENIPFIPKDSLDSKRVFSNLPALIKGYLRAGAYIGTGAFLDKSLGHIDVCIILPTEQVTSRYMKHFEVKAQK